MAQLRGDDLAAFYLGSWVEVTSSNVASARWDADANELSLTFHNGSMYLFPGIGPQEAESFARSSSKGGWVWDFINWPKRPYHRVF